MVANILQSLISDTKKSQKEIAFDLGLSQQRFNNYVTGKRDPDSALLRKFADYFGVSLDFLLGRDEDTKKEPDATHGTELSSGEQALIQLFRRVPSDKRELVLAMIEAALQSGGLL